MNDKPTKMKLQKTSIGSVRLHLTPWMDISYVRSLNLVKVTRKDDGKSVITEIVRRDFTAREFLLLKSKYYVIYNYSIN